METQSVRSIKSHESLLEYPVEVDSFLIPAAPRHSFSFQPTEMSISRKWRSCILLEATRRKSLLGLHTLPFEMRTVGRPSPCLAVLGFSPHVLPSIMSLHMFLK